MIENQYIKQSWNEEKITGKLQVPILRECANIEITANYIFHSELAELPTSAVAMKR